MLTNIGKQEKKSKTIDYTLPNI